MIACDIRLAAREYHPSLVAHWDAPRLAEHPTSADTGDDRGRSLVQEVSIPATPAHVKNVRTQVGKSRAYTCVVWFT